MASALLGGILGAGGSVLASGINAISSSIQQKRQQQYYQTNYLRQLNDTRKLRDEQNEIDRQNLVDHMSLTKQSYQNAGFSAQAALGGQTDQVSASTPAAPAGAMPSPVEGFKLNPSDMVAFAQANLLNKQAENQQIKNNYEDEMQSKTIQNLDATNKSIQSSTELTDQQKNNASQAYEFYKELYPLQIAGSRLDNMLKADNQKLFSAQIANFNAQTKNILERLKMDWQTLPFLTKMYAASAYQSYATGQLNRASVQQVFAYVDNLRSVTASNDQARQLDLILFPEKLAGQQAQNLNIKWDTTLKSAQFKTANAQLEVFQREHKPVYDWIRVGTELHGKLVNAIYLPMEKSVGIFKSISK